MSWITIVLWVITNIPTFITEFQKILDLIHSIPHGDALSLKHALGAAAKANDVEAFKAACGVAPLPKLVG